MMGQTRRKQYVEVIATHHIDGSVRPQKIIIMAGPAFDVEDVKGVAKAKALSTFEIANRYTIVVKGKETFLYEDGGRWFVEMRT